MTVGVIVGLDMPVTLQESKTVIEHLEARFPGVVFAVVQSASSVTFTFESSTATIEPDASRSVLIECA